MGANVCDAHDAGLHEACFVMERGSDSGLTSKTLTLSIGVLLFLRISAFSVRLDQSAASLTDTSF